MKGSEEKLNIELLMSRFLLLPVASFTNMD